jgi:hypothetical protein
MVFVKYAKRWYIWVTACCWTSIGLLMVVLSKLHYTRDVITAIVVVASVYHMLHVGYFNRPDVLLRRPLLRLFELDWYIFLEWGRFGRGDVFKSIWHNSNTRDVPPSEEAAEHSHHVHGSAYAPTTAIAPAVIVAAQ